MAAELFELEMLGDAVERRYRQARPEVEEMPWGTLDLKGIPEHAIIAARRSWTSATFQEYRTAAACCATQKALLEARAPIDLMAAFARFPLDELVHVELCARLAGELGGGTELIFEPEHLAYEPPRTLSALVRAAELVVRNFCVGEALSIPMLHGTWKQATLPLPRAILSRIVRDEAAHGIFGFTFLDWAQPMLGEEDLAYLSRCAQESIGEIHRLWDDVRARPRASQGHANALGWMETDHYLALAARSLESKVVAPLKARGFSVTGERLSKASS
jgi:hypothetical protein